MDRSGGESRDGFGKGVARDRIERSVSWAGGLGNGCVEDDRDYDGGGWVGW